MSEERKVPPEINRMLRGWYGCFIAWTIAHYLLGLYATVGAVVVASQKLPENILLSISVAVATAALTFLKAQAKSNTYSSAWRLLNTEKVCYLLDPTYSVDKLAQAYKHGEEIIAKVD